MSDQLEVVAVGARTPVGLTAETTAAAVRAGIARLEDYPFALENGEATTAACDARIDPALHGLSRMRALSESVLDEVERKLGLLSNRSVTLHVYLSVPQPRTGFSIHDGDHLAQRVAAHIQSKGMNPRVEIAGRGHAGAIAAVQQAAAAHDRMADVVSLILGVESYLDPHTLMWLDRQRLLAQPSCPNGFIPGEGAGCLVLANTRLRKQVGWPCHAWVGGVGLGHERQLRDSELGSMGEGMTEAVLAATRPSGAEVDTAYIDINGERYRSEEWGFVVLRTPELWRSLEYEAPSACWGDLGAAWPILAGVLAVRSFARSYAHGPRALVMAGSFDGLRGAMLLQEPQSM